MSYQIKVAPSILSADFTRLGAQIQEAETGGADLIHIDVMDGRFAPNITMGPFIVKAVRRATTLPLDVHLMIVEPDLHLHSFAEAGANIISVHLEACPNLNRTLNTIHQLGCKAGVAINPHTPASALSEVMYLLDTVIVMTVNPGFGGQSLIHQTLHKVAEIRAMIGDTHGRSIDLEVDGGITTDTAAAAAQAGANVLIAGSSVFSANQDIATAIGQLRRALES